MEADVDMNRAYQFPHTMEIEDRFSDKQKQVILGEIPLNLVHGRVFYNIQQTALKYGDPYCASGGNRCYL